MLQRKFAIQSYRLPTFLKRFSSTVPVDIAKLEQESPIIDTVDEDAKNKEEQIQLSRNKSRLRDGDRNLLYDQRPYQEELQWFHGTLRYKRRMYGRYGEQSGVNAELCWPTKQELQELQEYERVAHPYTIQEMIKSAQEENAIKKEETMKRQQNMLHKLSKLDGWVKEMEMRIAKKEAETNAARLKKERLIEEVRKHFGYKVDPKDEKFKELLEKKEKEQKKLAKEARKKEREAKLMEKLKSKKQEDVKDNPGENSEENKIESAEMSK